MAAESTASRASSNSARVSLGRTPTPEEDRPNSASVVVLSHALWQRRFGGDRGVIGNAITINGRPFTVIGVMPATFRFPDANIALCMPLRFTAGFYRDRNANFLETIARLRPGVSVEAARAELARVEQAFRGLTESDWRRPTLLQPLDETLPHWTLFELAGHFDISIGLTRMLISSQQDGQVGRDRVSFFIFSRVEHAPTVYDYAYTMVEGKSPGQMAGVLAETFSRTIEEARANPPDLVGSGYYALMRLGEFVPSRVVEAVGTFSKGNVLA